MFYKCIFQSFDDFKAEFPLNHPISRMLPDQSPPQTLPKNNRCQKRLGKTRKPKMGIRTSCPCVKCMQIINGNRLSDKVSKVRLITKKFG